MGNADDPAGQEEVADVAAVETAVRDLVDALGVPLVTAGPFAVDAVGRVQVDGPAAKGDGIVEVALLDDVLLGEHVGALEAAALALAGNVADPLQRQVLGIGKLARILDVVPDAVDHLPQLPLDGLGLVDGVQSPAVLDPPETAAVGAAVEVAVARAPW